MAQTKVKSGLLNFSDQTDFVKLPSGTTAQRPVSPEQGYSRYNTTDNKLEFWNGSIWQQLPGVVAPTIETVSYPGDDLAADPVGGQTITLTGTNFLAGASVEIDGTLASVVTVVSKTEITFTAPAKAAGDYDIFLTNGDNTTATFVNGISYNGVPSWTTATGNLGSFPAGSTIPTITLVATEPDSGVISYSVTTGALPTGLALTGADIDGNVPTPAGQTTYNFSVTASDDENQSTERAFNIVVYLQVTNTVSAVDPFGDSSGVALYRLENNATDESGNYDGTSTNVTYGAGQFGQAGVFNGTSSFIEYPLKGGFLNTRTTVSVSLWFKCSALADAGILFTDYASGSMNAQFYIATNGKYSGTTRYNSNDLNIPESTNSYNDNQWHNVVVIINQGDNTRKDYIDGALINSGTLPTGSWTGSVSQKITSGTIFNTDTSGYQYYFNGSIDQVRIFNTALTPLEVQSLYEERTVLCGGQAETVDILGDNSCIALYPLDGNANDLSGNYSGTPTAVSYGVGEFDLAGVFNGSSSKITLPSTAGVTLGASATYSVSFWLNVNNWSTFYRVFQMIPTATILNGVAFVLNSTTLTVGRSLGSATGSSALAALYRLTISLSESTWYNIVITINGSTVILYINGTQYILSTVENSQFPPSPNTLIGTDGNLVNNLNGSIDQVRIFNKALNATEVTTLYNETACEALVCSGTTNTLDILGDSSCIAAYPLDGSPLDLSGNYNGVQTNVTYPQGYFDLAGSFNGSSSYITINNTVSTALTFTASLWVNGVDMNRNSSDPNQIQTIFYNRNPYIVISQYGGNWDYTIKNSSSQNTTIGYATSNFNDNEWYNIVISCNGVGGQMIFYVNGQSVGTNTAPTSTINVASTGFIGSGGIGQYFNGQIDQVRFFNKALTAGEVTTLYNETSCN
jgi:hypothetical protein